MNKRQSILRPRIIRYRSPANILADDVEDWLKYTIAKIMPQIGYKSSITYSPNFAILKLKGPRGEFTIHYKRDSKTSPWPFGFEADRDDPNNMHAFGSWMANTFSKNSVYMEYDQESMSLFIMDAATKSSVVPLW